MHHPVVAVREALAKPGVGGLRFGTEQEHQIAGNHQAIDVMRPRVALDSVGDVLNTGEVGRRLARESRGDGGVCIELVEGCVARHLAPVDAVDVLAPAEDLPNEALNRGQRCSAGTVGSLGRGNAFAWLEQTDVEQGRERRVPQPWVVRVTDIFERTEARETLLDKICQPPEALCSRGGEPEVLGSTRQVRGVSIDVGLDGCEHRVVMIDCWWWGRLRALVAATPGGEGLAVVVIKRPLATTRLTVVQQHVVLSAHPRIKVLHPQPASRPCPVGELLAPTEKVRVESGLDRAADRLSDPRKVGLCLPPG